MTVGVFLPEGIEAELCAEIAKRQQHGIAKYGTTVAENPLSLRAWLQHAKEEAMDQAVYLARAIAELDAQAVPYVGPGRRKDDPQEPGATVNQSLPVADADGWIKWEGGECPVATDAYVRVTYRDFSTCSGHVSGAGRWTHTGDGDDIIAYRLSKEASHG